MARNRTPRFMNLFSPERRSARTYRWRKRFQKFSLSSWQSNRVVESVCNVFRAGAEATRIVRGATTSQLVMASGGRSLRMEGLEQRALLATDVYVNDNWNLVTDNGAIGVVDAGDIVQNDNDAVAPGTIQATYGVDGFGAVTTGSAVGSDSAFDNIQEAITAVAANGSVHVGAGVYNEDVLLDKLGVSLLGAGSGTTTLIGPIGLTPNATLTVAADYVEIAGLTITRAGNNTTDWNNAGLNSAGIAIQGAFTGALIRDSVLTGNRTGIDVNNSNGHTIRNNEIVDNRTGLIFRNQTDNLTVEENNISNNWTVGIVFLDASSGSNSPVQTATGSDFNNNNISGNWYGQVVDRQTGGLLPAPGANAKNFEGNWFGTANPGVTTANSAEPGYAAQIPVAFGGTAVAPPASSVAFYGPASANIDFDFALKTGLDTDVETTLGRGTFGFQGFTTPQVWVDDDWNILVDVGPGGLSPGDLVESDGDDDDTVVTGKYFGYDAFDSITAAYAGVQDSGEVFVLAGAFTGALSIDRDVDIIGQDALLSTFGSDPLSTPIAVTNDAVVLIEGLTVAGGIFGVDVDNADVTIRESKLTGGSAIGVLVDGNGTVVVENSTISGPNAGTGVAVIDGMATITGSVLNGRVDGVIVGANGAAELHNNDLSAAFTGKVIQANPAAGVVNASGNYWGTPNESAIAGKVLGSVDFSPYLAGGTASGVGFAGDFSLVYVTTLGSHAEAGGRIQDGVDRVLDNGVVRVNASDDGDLDDEPSDYYQETVSIVGRTGIDLLGAGAESTKISGPAASPSNSATIKVQSSTDTLIEGFAITRSGNTLAEWTTNNMTFGVLLAGGATNTTLQKNILRGNRTAVDIRNVGSGNNVIQDNDIIGNRTGVVIWDLSNDNTIRRNSITDNFTIGVLMFDTSNEATGNVVTNNAIAGNWYSQVEDRRPSSSAPRDFSGNWFGTNAIVTTTLGAEEPGYNDLIPTIYGGSASAPGGAKVISGAGANNVDYSPWLDSGTPLTPGQIGFDGDFSTLHVDDASPQSGVVGRITEGLNRLDDSPAPGTLIVHAGTYAESVDASTKAVKFELGTATAQVILNGNLALSANDTLVIELNGTSATNDYDNFVVNGSVALNGATLDLSRGFAPFPGDTFVVVSNDGVDPVVGNFAGLLEGAVISVAGVPMTLSYAGGDGNDVTLTIVQPNAVYVNDTWSELVDLSGGGSGIQVGDEVHDTGTDDDWIGDQLIFGYNAFASIQDAIDAVAATGTVNVLAGTYYEQVVVDKSLDLLGPYAGLAGNAGGRTAEATIRPTDSSPDPNVGTSPTLVYVTADNVRIAGLSFDGDNPGLTSGTTLNGADLDAEEAIASYEGVGGITVENNIIRNFSYTGVDFYNYNNGGAATSGNVIRQNLIENLGAFDWGIGILVYNNFYAHVTDNVMNDVRVGVQTGNFHLANPGATGSITGNVISASRAGIWHNLAYGSASPLAITGNTVSADSDASISRFSGIWVTSIATAASPVITGNTITVGAVAQGQTVGYDLWNNSVSGGVSISGGSVAGADYGVWVNNFDSYPTATGSNGSSTSATITGVAISDAAIAGVYAKDNASNTNSATVNVNVLNSTITGSGIGVLVEGADATATVTGNDFDDVADNATDLFITAGAGAVTIGAGNAFAGDTFFIDNRSTQSFDLSANSTTFDEANNYRIEDKMHHRVDTYLAPSTGLVTWVANNVYVTTPGVGSTDSSIQRGIDAAAAGNTVNVEAGTYDEALTIGKAIMLRGSVDLGGAPTTVLRPLATVGNLIEIVSSTTGAVTIEDFELDGNNAGVRADYGIRINSGTTFASLTLDNLSVKEFRNIGLSIDGNATGQSVDAVTLSNSVFTDNGDSGINGSGAVSLFSFNETASLTNVDVTNFGNGARSGIQFRGAGTAPYSSSSVVGISLNDVDVSGVYQTQMIGLQRYNSTAGISFNNVAVGGVTSAITGTFGASLRIDAVGAGTLASPATLSLGNTMFRGLAGSSAQPHEIEIAPDNAFAFLRLDGTGTNWSFGGSPAAAASLTLVQLFAVEDRILHFVDKLHPAHGLTFGAYKGFVDVKSGQAFVTDDSTSLNPLVGDGSIQRAVDVVATGGTVNVEAGTFTEAVSINRHVNVIGAGSGATVLNQPIAPNIITLTGSGASNVNPLLLEGLQLKPTGSGTHGILVPMGASIEHIKLDDVVITGSSPSGPAITEIGFRITDSADADDIVIVDSLFENLNHGMLIEKHLDITGSSNVTNLVVTNTGFEDNQSKGFYAEKLSDATFTNVWATGNGNLPFFVSGAGIEINLKGNIPTYANLVFANLTVTNNGLGTPTSGTPLGAGLQIKARGAGDTGGSGLYAANQATLTNVQVNGGTFTGNRTGIRVGEPGQSNTSPTGVVIDDVNVSNSTETGIHIVGGTATIQGATLTDNPTGVRVQGTGRAIIANDGTDKTLISGGTVGVDVNGGRALVANTVFTNTADVGVLIQSGGIADLGQTGPGTDFTGLGVSSGGNDFSSYIAAASASAGAIVNLNSGGAYAAAGPQGYAGAAKDVAAFNNTWAVSTPAGIENVVWHDADLGQTALGFIDYASLSNLVVSLEPLPGTPVVNEAVNEGSSTTVYGEFVNDAQSHQVTITWGDGSPNTVVVLAAGVTSFAIASPVGTYADDPNGPVQTILRNISVKVEEVATPANSLTDATLSVNVNNVVPDAALSTPDGVLNEGETLTLDVGAVVDPGTDAVQSYRINWGDGTFDVIVGNLSAVATHTHQYLDGLASPNVTVTLDLFDDDGTWNTVESLNILVNNINPTASGFFSFDAAVNEGSTTTVFFTGPFTDPGNPDTPFRFAFDFNGNGIYGEAGELGDGTYAGSVAASSVTVPAQFLADDDDSPRTIHARIIDNDGGFTEYTASISINNVAPVVNAGADSIALAGVAFSHTINFTDPGSDAPWTVNVDWNGDGDFLDADESAFGVGGHSFIISHTYAVGEIGNVYNVKVQVDDNDGGIDDDVFQVTVVENTLRVTNFVANASGFDVTFNQPLDLGVLNLYSGQGGPITLPDLTVVGSSVGAVKGSIIWNSATNMLSFVKTGGALAADTYTVTLVSGDAAFQNTLGSDLDGDANFTPGGNYVNAFGVTSSGERIVSIQDFARGAGQDVDLPIGTSSDFHIRIDNAAGVTAVDVDVAYDPALLDITGAFAAAGLPGGWSIVTNFVSPGLLKLTLSGTSPLVGSNLNLIRLVAEVPDAAAYGASQVIRLLNLRVNEDAIASKADYAVHKAVYVGDADGDGIYLGADASRISRVVVNLDSGFSAHPWTDPLIVADGSGDGTLSGQDASLVAQEAALIDTPEIPSLPGIVLLPALGGIDPELSIPVKFAAAGDTVTVPVRINVLTPEASDPTVVSATFDVFFNNSSLSLGVNDVAQGGFWTVGDDWSLTKNVLGGQARLVFFNSGGGQSLPGVGDIAYLTFTLDAGLTPGDVIPLNVQPVSATEGGLTWTEDDGAIAVTYTADFDVDGDVDGDDLNAWQTGFGTTPNATIAQGDADRNGDIDGSDFLAWQRQAGSVVSLPPATVQLSATMVTSELPALSAQLISPPADVQQGGEVVFAPLASKSLASDVLSSMLQPLAVAATPMETIARLSSSLPSAAWWLASPTDGGVRQAATVREEFDWDAAFDHWSNDDQSSSSDGTWATVTKTMKLVAVGTDEASGDEEESELFGQEMDEAILSWLES